MNVSILHPSVVWMNKLWECFEDAVRGPRASTFTRRAEASRIVPATHRLLSTCCPPTGTIVEQSPGQTNTNRHNTVATLVRLTFIRPDETCCLYLQHTQYGRRTQTMPTSASARSQSSDKAVKGSFKTLFNVQNKRFIKSKPGNIITMIDKW